LLFATAAKVAPIHPAMAASAQRKLRSCPVADHTFLYFLAS